MASALAQRQLGPSSRPAPGPISLNGFSAVRTLVLGLSRILFAALPVATVSAAPLSPVASYKNGFFKRASEEEPPEEAASAVVLYVASIALVLLGGAFAGLTIALMGQDSIYLQVLARDETDPQQKNARRVYNLLQRGKHWVLVTLLLSNVIVNETLPVVLDRCLGGGVAAVVGSTVLIVIFGEVLPQSICVRYGLQIGGVMAKPVLGLMWLMAPIAWPTAKLLDHALGEDHGTVYKKSGLKTLVTLHRSLGEVSERLNQDEVTIISAVLDLKEKPVSSVMTPMEDVFTMSEDTVLDEKMMDLILSAGYSRIPIHETGNPTNFIGMLLVKILITYDPDDKVRVSEFPLATLPETRPETSCLDIVNFFQEGKSHMVLVSQYPGEDNGALGVVTLEDVIEELIGEEIIDESDVYIDVHKAIRRMQPAPRARPVRHKSLVSEMRAAAAAAEGAKASDTSGSHAATDQGDLISTDLSRTDSQTFSTSPKMTTVMLRRRSQGADGRLSKDAIPVRASMDEMWQHLRHLGPSNPATNPKNTKSTTVKVKTNLGPRSSMTYGETPEPVSHESLHHDDPFHEDDDDNETTRLLKPDDSGDNDGMRISTRGYGTQEATSDLGKTVVPSRIEEEQVTSSGSGDDAKKTGADTKTGAGDDVASGVVSNSAAAATSSGAAGNAGSRQDTDGKKDQPGSQSTSVILQHDDGNTNIQLKPSSGASAAAEGSHRSGSRRSGSESGASGANVVVSVSDHTTKHSIVRSGSITENVIETRGIRKVVLETNSSAEEDDEAAASSSSQRRKHHILSGLRSPAVTSAPVSDVEQDRSPADPSRPSEESAAGPSSTAAASSSQHNSANQQGEGGAGKKKNRRKKRKGGGK